jgi:hypothetical protein
MTSNTARAQSLTQIVHGDDHDHVSFDFEKLDCYRVALQLNALASRLVPRGHRELRDQLTRAGLSILLIVQPWVCQEPHVLAQLPVEQDEHLAAPPHPGREAHAASHAEIHVAPIMELPVDLELGLEWSNREESDRGSIPAIGHSGLGDEEEPNITEETLG